MSSKDPLDAFSSTRAALAVQFEAFKALVADVEGRDPALLEHHQDVTLLTHQLRVHDELQGALEALWRERGEPALPALLDALLASLDRACVAADLECRRILLRKRGQWMGVWE